jgi:hypothetical protein
MGLKRKIKVEFICGSCRKKLEVEMTIEGYLIKQCNEHPDIAPIEIQDGVETSIAHFARKVGHESRSS